MQEQERKFNEETINTKLKKIALVVLAICIIRFEYVVYKASDGLLIALILGGIAIIWSISFTIGGIFIFFWNRVFEEKYKRIALKLVAVAAIDIAIVVQLLFWGYIYKDLHLLFASLMGLLPTIIIVLILFCISRKENN